jgi:hypothetical protein
MLCPPTATNFQWRNEMKNQMSLWVGYLLLAGVCMAPRAAHAQCTNASLVGGWGYELSGMITLSPWYQQFRAEAGLFTFDGAGNFTLTDTVSINGTVTRGQLSQGTYTVNSNCTGTLAVHRDPQVVHFTFQLATTSPVLLGTFPIPTIMPTDMALQCTDPDAEAYFPVQPGIGPGYRSVYVGTAAPQ